MGMTTGVLHSTKIVGFNIDESTNERISAIARNAGVSRSQLVRDMIAHLELTDQGIPTWMPPVDRAEELPIPAA